MEDKRHEKRYTPLPDVQAMFTSSIKTSQLTAKSSRIWDISKKGCSFASSDVEQFQKGMVGKLTLQCGYQKDEIENAKVERKWEKGIAVSYKRSTITDRYCKGDQLQRLAFAQRDYDLVHKEIMDIKSCRTNIFMGTLGVIGAIGVAIVGILGTSISTSWNNWLPFAAAIPTLLLTCSILSTIHKARGINERTGYLEALAEYIAWGKMPEFFCGWARASRVGRRCEIFKKLDFKFPELTCRGDPNCSELAKGFTHKYIDYIELKPYLLESFTSLSSHIYTGAYLISVFSLLTATMRALRDGILGFEPEIYWLIVGIGAVITSLFVIANVVSKKIVGLNNKGQFGIHRRYKGTLVEKLFKVYKHIAGFSLPVLFVVLIFKGDGGFYDIVRIIAIYGLGGAIAAASISAGYSFYDKLYSLRRGRYSLIRWRYIWKLRFAYCSLMIRDILV